MDGTAGCGGDRGPDVGFLRVGGEGVVVAVEREKSRELHPAVAEFLVRIAVEPAGIHAEHGDPEEGEGERLRDGEVHVRPEGGVVAAPVARPLPAPCESGAADDEGSDVGDGGEEGVVGGVEDLVAEEVMDVVIDGTVSVSGIGGEGVDG